MTPLIRNLLRRKYVWYDDRTDRTQRARWCRVIARRVVKNQLIVLAQSRWKDHVVFAWRTDWSDRRCIPSDHWGDASRKSGFDLFHNTIHFAEHGHYRGQTRRKCCQPWRRRMKYDACWHIS